MVLDVAPSLHGITVKGGLYPNNGQGCGFLGEGRLGVIPSVTYCVGGSSWKSVLSVVDERVPVVALKLEPGHQLVMGDNVLEDTSDYLIIS